jgi:predicted ATP-grasp superfamily ATP-dependent carboligase
MRRTAAVVMGGGFYGGYDIVRALGKAGIPSTVCSALPEVASRSRYACGTLRLPTFKEENFAEIFARIVEARPRSCVRPVLYYAGASEAMFLSQYGDQLTQYYRFLLPRPPVLEAATNKFSFMKLARAACLPVPRTWAFSNAADLAAALDTIDFPCIVKPARNQDWYWQQQIESRFGSYKRALRRFESRRELLDFCAVLPTGPAGFIVQSWVEGQEAVTCFHGYFDENSRCLGNFLSRDIRTSPPQVGEMTLSETFHDERLTRQSVEYLQRIGFRGIAKIDYKKDAASGQYKILEIESHYHVWHLLGTYAGVNLPAIASRHLNGEPVEPSDRYRDKVRLLWLSRDVWTYVSGYRKMGWTLTRYLASLTGVTHYRLFDALDPLPLIESAIRFTGRKWTSTTARLGSTRTRRAGSVL